VFCLVYCYVLDALLCCRALSLCCVDIIKINDVQLDGSLVPRHPLQNYCVLY